MRRAPGAPGAPGPRRLAGRAAASPALRYLAVGSLTYVLDVTVFALVLLPGAPVWVATTVGYWVSVTVNFTLNRQVVFAGARRGRLRRSLARYGALLVATYLAQLGLVSLLVSLGAAPVLSRTVAVALSATWNFALYRRWVFR